MKKLFIFIFIFVISVAYLYAGEKETFQAYMRTILETGGKIKNITDTLKPDTKLYIYSQLPTMKKTIDSSKDTINEIKSEAMLNIYDQSLQSILQDSASLQLLTIDVTGELLAIFEQNGQITSREYKNVVSKYDKEAKRLQNSLEKYKNM